MELLFKLAITLIVVALVYYQAIFLKSVWKSQLDPKAKAKAKATVLRIVVPGQ